VEKSVGAVGTDCLSIDHFSAYDLPAHVILLKQSIPIFENLNSLQQVERRCFVISIPLKIKDGTASSVRVLAIT
jgi:kynurenine formamidase